MSDRFEVRQEIGRGGFGIVYQAFDKVLGDLVAVKELAPSDATRIGEIVELGANADRLRQAFLEEARLMSRLRCPGVLGVRSWFSENGTAYFVTPLISGAETLQNLIKKSGKIDPDGALDIFFQVLETLDFLHAEGILHRDIKPSNILVDQTGRAYLIDFGSAREWRADMLVTHTVMFTPGFAPPEQLSEKGRRGPATDIYSLCATLYHAVSGFPPPSAPERASGSELEPLSSLGAVVGNAIQKGLSLAYHERPQTVSELRDLLNEQSFEEPDYIALDDLIVRSKSFSFNKRACPCCQSLLVEAKPLKRGQCPVCRKGTIRNRELHRNLCPICKTGVLHEYANDNPLGFCPECKLGILVPVKQGFLKRLVQLNCPECQARFSVEGAQIERMIPEPYVCGPATEWRQRSGRAAKVLVCDGCYSQLDPIIDGRWQVVYSSMTSPHNCLYPEEWARVAAGLEPGSGNAFCDHCQADYYFENEHATLVGADHDPHHFVNTQQGRLLDLERFRWIGVGKTSTKPGLICESCQTEFDFDQHYLRLVYSPSKKLSHLVGKPNTLEDWHRLSAGLLLAGEDRAARDQIAGLLRTAYLDGETGIDLTSSVMWRGPATRLWDGATGTLTITDKEISHGGLLRKWKLPFDAIRTVRAESNLLLLSIAGKTEELGIDITPLDVTFSLKSGNYVISLEASDLAKRMRAE